MFGPQIRFCLITFRPIASKQLNSLTSMGTLSWLGGAVVTHPRWVQDVPGSISGYGKGFNVWFVFFCFYFFFQQHIYGHKIPFVLLQC